MNFDFSVVTVCFNSEKTISRTLDSILAEASTFNGRVESIIIDGGSNDRTVPLIKEFISKSSINLSVTFISEPDNGIYDAMNKGLSLVRGKFVSILNSDDCYISGALNFVRDKFEQENIDILHGDVIWRYGSITDRDILVHHSGEADLSFLKAGMSINHPSVFCRAEVYKSLGIFDSSYQYVADWLWAIQLINTHFEVSYFPKELVLFDMGGVSNQVIVARTIEIQKVFFILYRDRVIDFSTILIVLTSLWSEFVILSVYKSVFPVSFRKLISKLRKTNFGKS